jgi:hypothetical protein
MAGQISGHMVLAAPTMMTPRSVAEEYPALMSPAIAWSTAKLLCPTRIVWHTALPKSITSKMLS